MEEQTELTVQYRIIMKAQYQDKVGDCIYIVSEREAKDLEAKGYAVILEVMEVEPPKRTITRGAAKLETATVRGGRERR